MVLLISVLLYLAVLAASLDCTSSQVYVKITKKTASWANEESFKILSGSITVYTSPSLTNNQERVIEVCLTSSTNNQYTLQMSDTAGDSWSDGAYIMMEGINGNIVYKAMMTESRTQTEPLSLYSPINKDGVWKYISSASGNWKDVNYSDSTWSEVTLGIASTSASGTQYFRKLFTGINDMAAFELQLKYRYGVVAYINGAEVYRDNMPDGEPTSTTQASGSYSAYDYHGTIRSAKDIVVSSVLAVEVHFSSISYQEFIQFNGFLSLYAGLSSSNNCYVAPTSVTTTTSGFISSTAAVSWTRNSGAYVSSPPGSLTFEFSGNVVPIVNSYRIWPYTNPYYSPIGFSIEGALTTTSGWESILTSSGGSYTSSQWRQFDLVETPSKYNLIRLTAQSSQSGTVYVYELQFLVCSRDPVTTIEYPETQYSFYRGREQVYIAPTLYGFSGCSVSPSLPEGINIDSDTCVITGVTNQLMSSTSYQITSTMGTTVRQTTISLAFIDCTGTLYKILRTHRLNAQYEYFRIRDSSNDNILYQIQSGHSLSSNADWTHYLCVTVDRFDVAFYSTSTYWGSGSYYYMYYMLPDGEEEMIVKGRYDNYQGNVHNVYLRRPAITDSEQWYYKMSEVPTNWHNSETSGWSQAAKGSFPTSSN